MKLLQPKPLLLAGSLGVLLAVLCGCGRSDDRAFSGTLIAPSAAVGSTLGGRIVAVNVQAGSTVRRGDVLVRFDDAEPRAALASAQGRLAQAQASLADLQSGTREPDLARAQALAQQQRAAFEHARLTAPQQLRILRAELRQAQAQLADARAAQRDAVLDERRMVSLHDTGDVSTQIRDAAVARETQARAEVANRAAAVRAARVQVINAETATLPQDTAAASAGYEAAQQGYRSLAIGPRPDQVRELQASIAAARGDVAAAESRLREAFVLAPAAGSVSDFDLHPGDMVAAGAPVATIDERGNPYVRIYVPQPQLENLKAGTKVRVRSDAVPGVDFGGYVEQIDSQAQFTPQNVQTASDRVTLSFGVKVRVRDPDGRLHGGTTAEVWLP